MTEAYLYSRLFEVGEDIAPANSVLSFTNEDGLGSQRVADYFGTTSREAALAAEYFSGPNALVATMMFTRVGLHQRPHVDGADVTEPFSQLQAVRGSLSIQFDGFDYAGDVDLAGAADFSAAASLIQGALHHMPIAAMTTGDTIVPESCSFTGQLNHAQLTIDEVYSGTFEVGGVLSGKGVVDNHGSSQVIAKRSDGHYSTFATCGSTVGEENLTETYGILTVGATTEGSVAVGDRVAEGGGVLSTTAILANLGNDRWLVNNAQDVSGNFTITAPPIVVSAQQIQGVGGSVRSFFTYQPDGRFGFDQNPSDLSFATGSAADALGLAQGDGGFDSSPGGQGGTFAQFMNDIVKGETNQFSSFQVIEGSGRFATAGQLWADSHPSYHFMAGYTSTTTEAGSSS